MGDGDAVGTGPGQAALAELVEDDLGEAGVGVGGGSEPGVRDLGEGGVPVQAVEGVGSEQVVVQELGECLGGLLVDESLGAEPV